MDTRKTQAARSERCESAPSVHLFFWLSMTSTLPSTTQLKVKASTHHRVGVVIKLFFTHSGPSSANSPGPEGMDLAHLDLGPEADLVILVTLPDWV